ncbi:chromatin accessibility complex protein 1-like [Teratosphaeria destructans]|uniref:Chromatin accessibility complex protein 1-like n=1 Tax=Teratosphaeria destructans TaxID=418781 RepID=A0A9W7VYG6_9PEZI|nr:chromatin accessibility complex protein 1-like [Teratosphaeria destructans]
MPYNNTPIVPSKDVTGTVSLPRTYAPPHPQPPLSLTPPPPPVARVKKIIHADDDIGPCSNNAAFAITLATEMFLQHLVEQAYNIVKAERKPRRNIQYRDVANAVARVENLEFLSDVVPKTTTLKAHREKMKEKADKGGERGQVTLDEFREGRAVGPEEERQDRMEVDREGEDTEEVAMESAEASREHTPDDVGKHEGDEDRDMS